MVTWTGHGKFAALLMVLLSCFVSVSGLYAAEKPLPVIPLEFKDATKSDVYRSNHLADRFRRLAAGIIPAQKNSWSVKVELIPLKEPQRFHLQPFEKKRMLTLRVPMRFQSWSSDTMAHNWLMSVFLLARMGEQPDLKKVDIIRRHWITRGLARLAAAQAKVGGIPYSSMPGAYALVSHGHCPSVKQIVQPPPGEFRETAVSKLDAEFAELLVVSASEAGIFQDRHGEVLLRLALADKKNDAYNLLCRVLESDRKYLKGQSVDQWFRAKAEFCLISVVNPFSIEYFEVRYLTLTSFTFQDKDGLKRTCDFQKNISSWKLVPDANARIGTLLAGLNMLALQAPADLGGTLHDIRLALIRLRTDMTDAALTELHQANRKLFARITEQINLEHTLRDAERRAAMPGGRMTQLLDAAAAARDNAYMVLPGIQNKLDRWDDYR